MVAIVFHTVCVVCVPTTVGLPNVNVPEVPPRLTVVAELLIANVVASPPMFNVVAVVLIRLNVV